MDESNQHYLLTTKASMQKNLNYRHIRRAIEKCMGNKILVVLQWEN